MRNRGVSGVLRQLLMLLMAVTSLYPIYFIIITSLKTQDAYTLNLTGIPHHPTLYNIGQALTAIPFPRWFGNTVLLTVSSVTLTILITALAAYALAWGRFAARALLLRLNIALMVVPPVILIIPIFVFVVRIGLINTYLSVIVFYAGLLVPFSVYLLTTFFKEVPHEMLESAEIDGLRPFGILWRIVIPLVVPALVTLVVVNVLWVWNELLIALVFLQNNDMRTIMSGLAMFQGRYNTNQPLIMAGSLLAMLPTVLLYLFGQRYFVKGLTAGIGK
jgi:raffinose/stachyose/melibiose transport system permease protein